MSDAIQHECGIAFLRLKKDLAFYLEKYGTAFYGLHKMQLLMEKQHNRGQDGVGLVNIKLNMPPGSRYISRVRSVKANPIQDVFEQVFEPFKRLEREAPEKLKNIAHLKHHVGFTGEVFLGHLRYGTYGKNEVDNCHPFLRQNNWVTRNLVLAGNFNLTNVDELFDALIGIGQHPKEKSDTVTVLERIGHFLDEENERIYQDFKALGYNKSQISKYISEKLDLISVLHRASKKWDGGYVMAGIVGNGSAFVLRDPVGIRPAFYYEDDEVLVVASERPVIQTVFNVKSGQIQELTPGSALIINPQGVHQEAPILPQKTIKKCVFERIYFSRGSDEDIYNERKQLGRLVAQQVLEKVNGNIDSCVFSYIPNTAEVSFYGMIKEIERVHDAQKAEQLHALGAKATLDAIKSILAAKTRIEKIAIKDAKLRTFITQDDARDDLVAHVYDVTYGAIVPGQDNLVIIDDSIVRGTTLKQSILRMLDRLEPKNIIVVSSAPQIRYPDCYGIDMAKMSEFVAFEAAISLLKERGMNALIEEVYESCKSQEALPKDEVTNAVKRIYEPFTDEEVSDRIALLLRPESLKANVQLVFQKIENVHKACPGHLGDWYFTGDYPTPGGNVVVNRSFINWMENRNERAY
ncbi:MAG: class II glutamine amidotransferase [Bacteroidetes bacterium]|nr:class II glutamine amidotransferase [Bacteroidota bacterium]NDB33912.1 amidophosphoribosyltransferase [Flavobacteriia bacterium]